MSNDITPPRLEVDTAKLPLMLSELRLPAIARMWAEMAQRSDREGWPAARFLSTLTEIEIAERARRRIERNMADARLSPDKTLDGFDFAHVPMLSRAQVAALASGDAWLGRGKNLLLFGPPARARRTSPPRSDAAWWRTATACCSPAQPNWSNASRQPDRNSP